MSNRPLSSTARGDVLPMFLTSETYKIGVYEPGLFGDQGTQPGGGKQ